MFTCLLNVKNFSTEFVDLDVLSLSLVIGSMTKNFLYLSYMFLCGDKQTRVLLGDLSGITDPNYSGSIALALGCIHHRWSLAST